MPRPRNILKVILSKKAVSVLIRQKDVGFLQYSPHKAGWLLSDNTQFDFNTVLTESVTLYAHWTFADNAGGNTEGESGGGCSGLFAGTSAIAAAALIGAAAVVLAKRKHRS